MLGRFTIALGMVLAGCHDSETLPPKVVGGSAEPPDFGCVDYAPKSGGGATADVVVYGATPSGVAAAVEAAELGKQVILLDAGMHLGGKYGNGIGIAEIRDPATADVDGGIARRVFDRIAEIYGPTWPAGATKFEPHIAASVISHLVCGTANLRVVLDAPLASVTANGGTIASITVGDQTVYTAREFVDASYEGDLLAAAGASWTLGREANAQYGETLNGVRPIGATYNIKFDPYVVPGDPTSGVLPHVSTTPPGIYGTADRRIQAYTYRVCVSDDPASSIPFAPPDGYDPAEFEATARLVEAQVASGTEVTLDRLITVQGLPNHKYDLNNVKDLSLDLVGGSADYPEASWPTRRAIAAEHERYVRAFLYFVATSPRLPTAVTTAASALGYCADEYVDNDHFPPQLYVRESRRLVGDTVVTENTLRGRVVDHPIGLGSYYVDVHPISLFAKDGFVAAEGHLGTDLPAYQIPYEALVPKRTELANLLVSHCVSATHVAFGSLRVEPTAMNMGQAAGAAASLAIDAGVAVQDVDYATLATRLRADGARLDLAP